jgi:decaprenylphospho-beta-D-ribofuranose 2-oxidase
LDVPIDAPGWLLNRASILAFNEAFYRKQLRDEVHTITHHEPFFFPLDVVRNWNRGYGSRGFLQYQLVVPHNPEHRAIRGVLEEIRSAGIFSFLAVIKEFGDRPHGGLSFPEPGVTLAMDFPYTGRSLLELFERLDRIVLDAGGKLYLGKDARLGRDTFRRMYPRWERWRAVREKWDPDQVFQSDLGRRLGLCGRV